MCQNQRKLSPTTCDHSKLKGVTESVDHSKLKGVTESVDYPGEKHHYNIKLSEKFVSRIQRRDESKSKAQL